MCNRKYVADRFDLDERLRPAFDQEVNGADGCAHLAAHTMSSGGYLLEQCGFKLPLGLLFFAGRQANAFIATPRIIGIKKIPALPWQNQSDRPGVSVLE